MSSCAGNQFLRQVARVFVEQVCRQADGSGVEAGGLDGYTFVFPNRRSMLFFRKYLGEEYGRAFDGRPLLAPRQITVNELFALLSGLEPADPVEVLYRLYRGYVHLTGTPEPFDEFMYWGDVLLRDFDDADKYLADARQLFANVKDLRELDGNFEYLSAAQRAAVEKFWGNFFKGEKGGRSEAKREFLSLWQVLGELYERLRADLARDGKGYEGMIYRSAVEELGAPEAGRFRNPEENRTESGAEENETAGAEEDAAGRSAEAALEKLGTVVFIGLNAPNPCELKLMKHLRERGRGDFYWDFYGDMITDPRNKSSEVTAQLVRDFRSRYPLEAAEAGEDVFGDRTFEAVGVPSAVGQTLVAGDILNRLEGDPLRTAVVLPDENLLMPMLDAVPARYEKVNVTMGYPLRATGLASLVTLLSALQQEVREKGGRYYLYGRSVLDILNHEYVLAAAPERAREVRQAIVRRNIIFIRTDDPLLRGTAGCGEPVLERLFGPLEDLARGAAAEPSAQCRPIAEYQLALFRELEPYLGGPDRNYLYQYAAELNRLTQLEIPMRADTFLRLLRQRVDGMKIPFRGEPLQGLQIMGTLETRALDFDNLIFLSFNEGVYPASAPDPSFIPYTLRKGFGLPTCEYQDRVAAYHFYRLIHRARRVYFIYDTRTEGVKGGEESRFVKQLRLHFGRQVESSFPRYGYALPEKSSIEVRKDDRVMEILKTKLFEESELSATALNGYIDCPLRFYFRKVEGLRDEEEELEESVSAATFGTIFHYCMENLYRPCENSEVTAGMLEQIKKNGQAIDRLIAEGFRNELKIEEISGENLIVQALIKKYVEITLEADKALTPFVYVKGEKEYRDRLDGVRFMAKIDRIDRVTGPEGEILRLSDYKTGELGNIQGDLDVEQLFVPAVGKAGKKRGTLFQLLLYSLIYCRQEGEEDRTVRMTVYPIRTLASGDAVSVDIAPQKRQEFAARLSGLLAEILDPQVPFRMCENKDCCLYCDYKNICNR